MSSWDDELKSAGLSSDSSTKKVSNKAVYKGTDTIQNITNPTKTKPGSAWGQQLESIGITSPESKKKPVTSPEVQQRAEDIVKAQQSGKKKESIWTTIGNGIDQLSGGKISKTLGFGKSAVKTTVNATIVDPAKTLAELEQGVIEEVKKPKSDKSKVTLKQFGKEVIPATGKVFRGLAQWVWSGTAGSLLRATEDFVVNPAVRKVTGKKDAGPSMVKSPFGTDSEVAQDAFARRKAEGMSNAEALGAATADLAMNIGMILGTVEQIKAAPRNMRNLPVFRAENKVTIRVKDVETVLNGGKLSPAKERAMIQVEKDPNYIKTSNAITRKAIEKGIDVVTARKTSFAERLGINPDDLGVTIRVGKKPAFGQKPTMGQFVALEGMKELPPELMDPSPRGLFPKSKPAEELLPSPPVEQAPKITRAQREANVKEMQSEARQHKKIALEAQAEAERLKGGHEPVAPENLTAVTTDKPPRVGGYVQDTTGRVFKVADEPTPGVFVIEEWKNGKLVKQKETTVDSMEYNGVRQVNPQSEPRSVVPDEAKIKAAEARARANEEAAAALERRIVQANIEAGQRAKPKAAERVIKKTHLRPLQFEGAPTKSLEALKPGDIVVQKNVTYKLGKEITKAGDRVRSWEATIDSSKIKNVKPGQKVILHQGHMITRKMGVVTKIMENQPGKGQAPEPLGRVPEGKATKKLSEENPSTEDRRYNQTAEVQADRNTPAEGKTPESETKRSTLNEIVAERIKRNKAEKLDRIATDEQRKAYEAQTPKERIKVIDETPESNPVQVKQVKAAVKRSNRFTEFIANTKKVWNEVFNPTKNLNADSRAIVKRYMIRQKQAEIKAQVAGELFEDIPKKIGDNVTRQHEQGIKTKWSERMTQAYADLLEIAKEKLDKTFNEFMNYAGRLEYFDSPKQIIEAVIKKLMDKGMSKADAKAWAEGKSELSPEEAVRLKVNPSFTKNRFFETTVEAEKYGLHPKNLHPAQRYANWVRELEMALANKEFYDALLKNNDIAPSGTAPASYKEVNSNFMPNMKAKPEIADFINGQYEVTGQPIVQRFLRAIPRKGHAISKFMTNMVLSAGVPLTPINFLSSSYMLLRAGYGGDFASIGAYIRSFSNAKSLAKFKSAEYIRAIWEMARENHAVGQSLASSNILHESIPAMWKKSKLMAANAMWERAWSKRTFNSLLPQMQIEHYLSIKRALIKKGYTAIEARGIAARSMALSYGTIDTNQRSKLTEDLLSSVFFAPKFRESMVNMSLNMIKSLATPEAWKDPAYQSPRKAAISMMTMYGLANVVNHKLNGHYMWDNPQGKELALQVPLPDGRRNLYVPLLPSILGLQKSLVIGTTELLKGNPGKAARQFGQVQSIPLRIIEQVATNKDAFGKPIWYNAENAWMSKNRQASSPGEIVWNIMTHIAKNSSHPYLQEPMEIMINDKPVDEAVAKMFEFLPTFANKESEQLSAAIDAGQELAKYISGFVPEHKPELIYRELIKWPAPLRETIVRELQKADPNLKESKYIVTDEELKKWEIGPHPVKLQKGLDSVAFDLSEDRIVIIDTGDWIRTYGQAFLRSPVATIRGLAQRDMIRKFRDPKDRKPGEWSGIVVWERRKDLPLSVKKGYEVDHILPKAFGGDDKRKNLQYLTIKENRDKTSVQNMLMKEYEEGRMTEREIIDIMTNRNHAVDGDVNAQWREYFAKMTKREADYWYQINIPKKK